MTPILALAVAVGALFGAPARYLLDRFVSGRIESDLPWGTFLINTLGSLVLGLLTGLSIGHHLGPVLKTLLGVGFCGAFTTFSAFSFETVGLIEDGRLLEAAANIGASVAAGLGGAAVGVVIGLAL